MASPRGDHQVPQFGNLMIGEPLVDGGALRIQELQRPGFGLELNPEITLVRPTVAGLRESSPYGPPSTHRP